MAVNNPGSSFNFTSNTDVKVGSKQPEMDTSGVNNNGQQNNTYTKVSIFSKYDDSGDKTVNYDEANNHALFKGVKNVNDFFKDDDFKDIGENLRDSARALGVGKFSTQAKGILNQLKSFNVSNLFKELTNVSAEETATEKGNLDKLVTDQANTKVIDVNALLDDAYKAALEEAKNEATSDKGKKMDQTKAQDEIFDTIHTNKWSMSDPKDHDVYTATAYSKYDTTPDEHVTSGEIKQSGMKFNVNINNYVDKSLSGDAGKAAEENIKNRAEAELNNWKGVDYTAEEVTGTKAEVDAKVKELKQQADKTVETGVQAFLNNLDNTLKQEAKTPIAPQTPPPSGAPQTPPPPGAPQTPDAKESNNPPGGPEGKPGVQGNPKTGGPGGPRGSQGNDILSNMLTTIAAGMFDNLMSNLLGINTNLAASLRDAQTNPKSTPDNKQVDKSESESDAPQLTSADKAKLDKFGKAKLNKNAALVALKYGGKLDNDENPKAVIFNLPGGGQKTVSIEELNNHLDKHIKDLETKEN